ncbi:MAG: 4Fe-4S dicluster domain-containing protein [bacterium]|jgi:Fe-S-cluster-containing hydrogenase component 2
MKIGLNEALCSGCRVCQLVCSLQHFGENNPKKAALKILGKFPAPGRFAIAVCDQCGVCAEVCPTGAIEKVGGAYMIDSDKCTGCYVCVEACPLGVMFVHKDEKAPIKCDLCGECIKYCPRGAIFDADKAKE